MKDGPYIASIAALIGDPARANMLTALMDGRALTVSELAAAAGVTLPTASGHLAKLNAAQLLAAEKQGRHRYFRIADADVAQVLESLMSLAQRTGAVRVRTGPRDATLRAARVCYDHLAGARGVQLLAALRQREWLTEELELTAAGAGFLADFGIDADGLRQARRPLCRACLDWSERRHHLGGALGAALLARLIEIGWVQRGDGRALLFTPEGAGQFDRRFGPAG